MANYKYLIIGAGMTADAAVRGIRELDQNGTIGLIGSDPNPPYNRPPLTKGLWKGKKLESIWRQTQQFSVDLHLGRTAVSLDPQNKLVRDDQGDEYTYEKLLLATGGTPRMLPFSPPDVIYYRTLQDYQRVREMIDHAERIGVIGGGYIGSEIAAALSMNGKKVTMLFPESGIGAKWLPRELSDYLNLYYRQKGVEVIPGVIVQYIQKRSDSYKLDIGAGQEIDVDGVIAGIGIKPNTKLAKDAGLKVNNGIWVDKTLHTSQPDIFAAGDVAEFENPILNKRLRIEHEDNANSMGTQAGRNMASANQPYDYLSYFYSDMFELGYEAVGEFDSRLETYSDWKEKFKKGVIYYLAKWRVRGVLLWNVWEAVPKARELLADPGPFTTADLKGRL
jgi:3-phenylpropionate/trans-cinnamate dioxygenase ferredoxin reductase subunit